ncbi:MAG: RnfABCDGE type electron transport complex subunit G [Acetivibrio sp.]
MEKSKKKDTMVGDALKLFVITLIAGTLLGLVYQVTKVPIAEAKERAKQEAYQRVFKEAASFESEETLSGAIDNTTAGVFISEILVAKDGDGKKIGYVLSFGSKEGYSGQIDLSMGVDVNGAITGLEVLSMSETAGLGANCTTEEFKKQFNGIQSGEIVYTKTGKTQDNEIDALSGATITTKAITNGVNNALAFVYKNCDIAGKNSVTE